MEEEDKTEYEHVISTYYGEEQVTALVHLKVDTKEAERVAEKVSGFLVVEDVFLVTGDTDIVAKVKVQNYSQLKRFLVDDLSSIPGLKDSRTLMVVSTFKERGDLKFEPEEAKQE